MHSNDSSRKIDLQVYVLWNTCVMRKPQVIAFQHEYLSEVI